MIDLDGDEHTCQRALISKEFTPRRIALLEDKIRSITDDLIAKVVTKGECDLVRDLARPVGRLRVGLVERSRRARLELSSLGRTDRDRQARPKATEITGDAGAPLP